MKPTARRSQRGMASILITMITMMVISLIVLGFANVARRERGQSLDRQLSTQAFYTAESGIEDARRVIDKAIEKDLAVPSKDGCAINTTNMAGYPVSYPTGPGTVLKQNNASYSCLLVNATPTSLQYNGVEVDDSVVVPVKAASPIQRIEITWSPSTKPDPDCDRTSRTTSGVVNGKTCQPTNCLPANTNMTTDRFLLPRNAWRCLYGLMRMDVVATAPQATINGVPNVQLSRNRLVNSSVAAWFVPTRDTAAPGTLNFGGRSNANVNNVNAGGNTIPNYVEASCQGPVYTTCKATLNGLSAGQEYALRLSSLYKPSNVTVMAYDSSNQPMPLSGAQAVVDVTGKSQDVLRRIVARVPVNASRGQVPGYAVQSNGSLCKRFEVTPGFFEIPGTFPSLQPDNSNAMCQPVKDGTPASTPAP